MQKSVSGPALHAAAGATSSPTATHKGFTSPKQFPADSVAPRYPARTDGWKAGPGFRAVKGQGSTGRPVKHGMLPKLKSPPTMPGFGVQQRSLELWQRGNSLTDLGAPPEHLVLMLKRSQHEQSEPNAVIQQRGFTSQSPGSKIGSEAAKNGTMRQTQWRSSWEFPSHRQGGSMQQPQLEDISSVTRRICQDLDRTCGILLSRVDTDDGSGEQAELDGHFHALHAITEATSKVKDGLEESLIQPVRENSDPMGYDDPLLQKARQLSTVAAKICEDLQETYKGRTDTDEFQDVSALQEIATVTMTIKDNMARLQEESWANGVLNQPAEEEEPEQRVASQPTSDIGSPGTRRRQSSIFREPNFEASSVGDSLGYWDDARMLGQPSGGPAESLPTGGEASPGTRLSVVEDVGSEAGSGAGSGSIIAGSNPGGRRRSGQSLRKMASFAPDLETAAEEGPASGQGAPGHQQDSATEQEPAGRGEVYGLPSLAERIARLKRKDIGDLGEDELERIRTAFNRFRVPGTGDLHRDNLVELLNYLGHVITAGDQFPEIWNRVTNYDYIDFDEFMSYIEHYLRYEKDQYRLIFDAYDEDGSGEISIGELRSLTAHLGIAPRQGMMKEALELVDEDSNGQLGFDELRKFLVVYRHTEGFTREEVKQLRRVFDRLSGQFNEGRLPMDLLCDALVRVFGLQVEGEAKKLEEKLRRAAGGDPLGAEGFLFAEFLVFARRVREGQKAALDAEYGTRDEEDLSCYDADNSGMISRTELRQALFKMGYEPLRSVMDEVFGEVMDSNVPPDAEMDLHQFFDFLLIYRQREGFLKSEVEGFWKVFQRFDEDGSEQISALELSDIFRFLGYTPSMDDIHILLRQVDSNGTNELDFRELLKLMQIYRNTEINRMRTIFVENAGEGDLLSKEGLVQALKEAGHSPSKNMMNMNGVDCDTFISVVDMCREEHVIRQRKKAGFNATELDHFMEVFNRLDKDGSGVVDSMELQVILKEFGWEPRTREEQDKLLKKFDVARSLAKEAGITETTPVGGASIKFWEFVQLARILQKERDREEEAVVDKLIKELKFTHSEVDDFRQVFRDWTKPDENQMMGDIEATKNLYLGRETVRRIARTLGIHLTSKFGDQLEQQLNLLEESYNKLNFKGFLRLMRWLVDCNVAAVKEEDDE